MKRADKIRLAEAVAAADDRDKGAREAARQEWGHVRKAAREAFMAHQDWRSILNDYRGRAGFYTPDERARMCDAYAEELAMKSLR